MLRRSVSLVGRNVFGLENGIFLLAQKRYVCACYYQPFALQLRVALTLCYINQGLSFHYSNLKTSTWLRLERLVNVRERRERDMNQRKSVCQRAELGRSGLWSSMANVEGLGALKAKVGPHLIWNWVLSALIFSAPSLSLSLHANWLLCCIPLPFSILLWG